MAVVVGVEPEQGAHRDPHGEPAHPRVYVDASARSQAVDLGFGLGSHDLDRALDPLAVKGRHHDPARSVVVGTVDRQQPVTEQRDEVAEAPLAPVKALGMGDGDEVVCLGPEHPDASRVQQPDAEDRAVALIEREQDGERVMRHPP